MNTEERQLSEMLHRVTPEPPRRVTVEDVAYRVAEPAGRPRGSRLRRRPDRPRSRAWAPVLAAASVFAVAAASAGIAVGLTSHPGPTAGAGGAPATSSSAPAASSSAAEPTRAPASRQPAWPPAPIAGGPWGAELINPDALAQDSLTGHGNSLYAVASGALVRIDAATGNVAESTRYSEPLASPPVVVGNTVWVVWSYGGGVVLHGYDGTTLAQVASVAVPVTGQVSGTAQGVLTAGPDGNLYVAAGRAVAVVDPSARQVTRTIAVSAGPASSVAASPDGSRLYVSTGSIELLIYNPATGAPLGSSAAAGSASGGGNLVATSGGVWGTAGVGMTQWVWFAPDGNLTRMVRVTQGASGGLESVPTFSGGKVWIGGSRTLACADPATGRILASAAIPADHGVLEYFGRVTVLGGRAYSDYLDDHSQRAGVVRMTPPAACSG